MLEISKAQRGIKRMAFKIASFLFHLYKKKLGILVPVYFGTRLGVSLAAPKGVSKRMVIKMASLLSFDTLIFWFPFVWYLCGCLQGNPPRLENKGEACHFLEILEDLFENFETRDSSCERTPFEMTTSLSFHSLVFLFYQGKTSNLPRIFSHCRTHKSLGKTEKIPK